MEEKKIEGLKNLITELDILKKIALQSCQSEKEEELALHLKENFKKFGKIWIAFSKFLKKHVLDKESMVDTNLIGHFAKNSLE